MAQVTQGSKDNVDQLDRPANVVHRDLKDLLDRLVLKESKGNVVNLGNQDKLEPQENGVRQDDRGLLDQMDQLDQLENKDSVVRLVKEGNLDVMVSLILVHNFYLV